MSQIWLYQKLELSCSTIRSICTAVQLKELVATQRSSWWGAFSEDLWLAQTHGSGLTPSSSRWETLGPGECLFTLWMDLQRKVVIFVKAISLQVRRVASCLTNSSSYQENKLPDFSRSIRVYFWGIVWQWVGSYSIGVWELLSLVESFFSVHFAFFSYFCCPLLLDPLTPLTPYSWRHSGNMQLMVLCQVPESNVYRSCSLYKMFHFHLVQYGKQWVIYRTHIDWHKLLKGKSDMDLMHMLMENSSSFSQICS